MKIIQVNEDISIKRSVDSGTEEQRAIVKKLLPPLRMAVIKPLIAYTEKFDRVQLASLTVTEDEIEEAYKQVSEEMVSIIQEAAANIRTFHEKQLRNSWMTTEENGTILRAKSHTT